MPTQVVNISDGLPVMNGVYIGRRGKGKSGYFGNPFVLSIDGNRDEILEKYRIYFIGRLRIDPDFYAKVHSLKGKTLVCFCKPKKCHGDIIAEYVDGSEV